MYHNEENIKMYLKIQIVNSFVLRKINGPFSMNWVRVDPTIYRMFMNTRKTLMSVHKDAIDKQILCFLPHCGTCQDVLLMTCCVQKNQMMVGIRCSSCPSYATILRFTYWLINSVLNKTLHYKPSVEYIKQNYKQSGT